MSTSATHTARLHRLKALFRFSLRTLLVLTLFIGSASLSWLKREPWALQRSLDFPDDVESLNYSPDGRKLAVSFQHGPRMAIVDCERGALLGLLEGSGDETFVAWADTSVRLMSRSSDGHVRIWDANTCTLLHAAAALDGELAPDGRRVAILNAQTTTVIDLERKQALAEIAGAGTSLCFTRDGSGLCIVPAAGSARMYDASNGKELWRTQTESTILASCFSHDRSRIAFGTMKPAATLHFYDSVSGTQLRSIPWDDGEIKGFRFSPDDNLLAVLSEDSAGKKHVISVFNVADGKRQSRMVTTSENDLIEFSRDGCRLLAASDSNCDESPLDIFDVATAQRLGQINKSDRLIPTPLLSCDGSRLATFYHGIKIWDARTGVGRYEPIYDSGVFAGAWSPANLNFVTGFSNNIKLWQYCRREGVDGLLCLPELWMAVFFGLGLLFSLRADGHRART